MDDKLLVFFSNRDKFDAATQGVEYDFTSIVFIGKEREIWNRGITYTSFAGFADFLTREAADLLYQPKGKYLTEHQDLSEYAKSEEVTQEIATAIEELKNLLLDGATDAFDTFKEFEEWIEKHGTEAASMLESITALETNKADKTELNEAKTELEGKINDAKTNVEGQLSEAKSELEGKINDAKTNVEGQLSEAKTELEGKINQAKSDLEQAIETATDDMATKTYVGEQIESAKSELESKIEEATDDMATQTWTSGEIASVKEELEGQINSAKSDLEQAIETATDDMATQTWTSGEIENTKSDLESQLEEAKTELEGKIENAGSDAEDNLNTAKSELEGKINQAKSDLEQAIETATNDMATQTWVNGELEEAKEEIDGKINQAKTDLQDEISSATDDMATKTWVEGKKYLTEHQSLDEYAKTEEIQPMIEQAQQEVGNVRQEVMQMQQTLEDKADRSDLNDYVSNEQYWQDQEMQREQINNTINRSLYSIESAPYSGLPTIGPSSQNLIMCYMQGSGDFNLEGWNPGYPNNDGYWEEGRNKQIIILNTGSDAVTIAIPTSAYIAPSESWSCISNTDEITIAPGKYGEISILRGKDAQTMQDAMFIRAIGADED